jgi:hypothetical protein
VARPLVASWGLAQVGISPVRSTSWSKSPLPFVLVIFNSVTMGQEFEPVKRRFPHVTQLRHRSNASRAAKQLLLIKQLECLT